MGVAVLDTNVLFASASARDEYHEVATAIIREIDHGILPNAVVTDYVVAETLTLIGAKLTADTATGMLDRLIEGSHFEVVQTPQADFAAAQPIFRRYAQLSFVDASIVAYMERNGIEYLYSVDDDFDAIDDITRLGTATDPFD